MRAKVFKYFNIILNDKADKSLLTKSESIVIKGLLILFVVFGHNKYLMQGGDCNRFLYSFHVYAFYILPFLYDFKKIKFLKLVSKNLKRLYVPYTIAFILLLSVSAYIYKSEFCIIDSIIAYICGSQYLLKSTLGFGSFLWFIPTLFSVLIVRYLYYSYNRAVRIILLIISAVCLVGFAFMIHPLTLLWWYSPFCIFLGIAMLLPSIICRILFIHMNDSIKINLLFFCLILCFFVIFPISESYLYEYLFLVRIVAPILIFLFILNLKNYLVNITILKNLGNNTFPIYLIHLLLYNIIYIYLDKYLINGLYVGLLLFIITITLSYYISKLRIIKFCFPH